MKNKESFNFNSLGLLQFAILKWKPLIIFPFLATIAAALISFTITPLFRSSVIMFPVAQTSVSQTLLSARSATEDGISTIGEEEQAEQLLQILNSESIRSRIVEKYNLMEHYGIDPNPKNYPYTKLYARYKKNIKAKRTEFMSVEVSVMDSDPQTAANIANDISALVDTIMNHTLKERAVKAFKIVEQEYNTLKRQIKEMEDSLDILRSMGIVEYEKQAQAYTEGYSQAIAMGNYKSAEILKKDLKNLADNGGGYIALMLMLEFETEQLSLLKTKYSQAKVEAEQKVPHKFIVDSAYKAERKSYPKRSLIVIFTALSTFLFTFLVLLIFENIKNIIPAVENKKA